MRCIFSQSNPFSPSGFPSANFMIPRDKSPPEEVGKLKSTYNKRAVEGEDWDGGGGGVEGGFCAEQTI